MQNIPFIISEIVGVEFRSIAKLSDFKSALLKLIRPTKKEIFDLHNPDGTKRIYQLRVGLSPLKAHKKLIIFRILIVIYVCVVTVQKIPIIFYFFVHSSPRKDQYLFLM